MTINCELTVKELAQLLKVFQAREQNIGVSIDGENVYDLVKKT